MVRLLFLLFYTIELNSFLESVFYIRLSGYGHDAPAGKELLILPTFRGLRLAKCITSY
jgi:hypothetical protein